MKITLAEAIALGKQKESEIFKLTQLINSIIGQSFEEKKFLGLKEEYSAKEFNQAKKDFMQEKIIKVNEIQDKLDKEIKDNIILRNKVNKTNIKIGQDSNLIKMKWIRIELDNKMKLLSRSSFGESLDNKVFEELGIGKKVKELENKKNKLDNIIQKLNHTTEITLDL